MEKVYQVEREDTCLSIKELFENDNISTYDSDVLDKALDIFNAEKIDFVDTLLCAYALVRNHNVKTIDKKIKKYIARKKEELSGNKHSK